MFLRILLVLALVSVLVLFLAALNYEVLIHSSVPGDQVRAKNFQKLNFSFEQYVPFGLNNETTELPSIIQPLLIQRLGSIRVSNATDYEEVTLSIGGITKIHTTPRPIPTPKQANNPTTCGQTQHGFTAVGQAAHLNSLNFPNSYPLNLDCSYLLTSPVNTRMTVRCDTFNVPCTTDTFYYSLDGGNKYFGYCGQGIVKPMTTKGNRLYVVFHSGSQRPNSQAKTRFQCKITVIGPITPVPSTNCSCGVRNVDGANRIVGGTPTKAGEIPWRVAVFVYEIATQFGEICGGAIINPNWILTAAHCTQNFQEGYQINVYPGAQANPVTTGGVDPIVVDRYIQHPDYSRITLDNDICLLHLSTPLTYRANISSVCLPYPLVNFNLSGTTALASGFGTTQAVASGEDGGPVSNTLLKVDLPILTTTECSKYQRVTNNMICTYLPGKDTCQGDSGGSLDYKYKNDRYYAVGIVSHGIGCGQSDYPGVYTKVTNYLNWIQTATKETFCQV